MKIFLFLILAAAASAQAPANLRGGACRSTSAVQLTAVVPVTVGASTVPVSLCVDLGAGLRLNTATTPAKIEIDPAALPTPPAANVPRMAMKRVLLSVVVPDVPGINQMSVPLEFTPAPGTMVLAVFRSSRLGGDVVEIIPSEGWASPKQLQVTLPAYRPFTTDDVLTVLYWTLDAP